MNPFAIRGDICWSKSPGALETMPDSFLVCTDEGKSAGVFARLPPQYAALPVCDYRGRLVIPGLVDLHTHAPQFAEFKKVTVTHAPPWGKEQEGRMSYERGIAEALSIFKEVQTTADPQTIILAEYTFLSQELQFCEKSDKESFNSLNKAIQRFDDAFLALKAVEEGSYLAVDQCIPHDKDYRVSGYPKDAFHIACGSHITRIKNMLRTPGIDPIEKALLKQRLANLPTAQNGYIEKQKKALSLL